MNDITTRTLGRLDITVPEQEFEAGKPGTISILIKNPFDTPIDILEVMGPRSPHLQELLDTGEQRERVQKSAWKAFRDRLTPGAFEIQLSGVRLEFPQSKQTLTLNAEKNSTLLFDRELDSYENVTINAEEGAVVTITPKVAAHTENKEAIQHVAPHCDTVIYVSVSTKNWLLFKPTVLRLNSQLKYRVGVDEKTQVISTSISVKPPIKAVIIGALFGATLGTLAKLFQTPNTWASAESLIAVGGAAVMSLIATIALSRKSGTQGFITVEDFYGGFATGALIGYGGSEYFEQAITPNQMLPPTAEGG
jgi:hypothetical protein